MTPLRLRRRLHSIALSFIGEPPDVREALEQSEHLCERWRASCLATDALRVEAERECDNLRATFDAERREWRRLVCEAEADGERLSQSISTIRAELAAAVEERDRALDSAREAVAGEALLREQRAAWRNRAMDAIDKERALRDDLGAMTCERNLARREVATIREDRDRLREALAPFAAPGWGEGEAFRRARAALAEPQAQADEGPKRKRTKEERWEARKRVLAAVWGFDPMATDIRDYINGNGPSCSRAIAEAVAIPYNESREEAVGDVMRLVSDLARAGYLTVAKGPKGVRVYSVKEGA